MKTINNQSKHIVINNEPKFITTADLIKDCVNGIPKDGLTIEDMAARLRVVDTINKVKEENETIINLEDQDFKTACDCIKQMRWAVVDQFIVDFANTFLKQ